MSCLGATRAFQRNLPSRDNVVIFWGEVKCVRTNERRVMLEGWEVQRSGLVGGQVIAPQPLRSGAATFSLIICTICRSAVK